MNANKPRAALGLFVLLILVVSGALYIKYFAAPNPNAKAMSFVVALGTSESATVAKLQTEGFIKSGRAFDLALALDGFHGTVAPGGYSISPAMNAWEVAAALRAAPSSVWVVIPPGLRKEEIGTILAKALDWTPVQLNEWTTVDTASPADYFEGVYFPDSYLIPTGESPADAAKRLQAHFEEEFAPYAAEAAKQNIIWTTALKVASIIQREAGGPNDMPIVSGIIWNRLLDGMKLQVDSTVQYARGDTPNGWWAPIKPADENIDSPYNTYLHSGLPPTPIDNPGLDAINAALNPATTDCLYYIHDNSGTIHCSATYAGQVANIKKYLQ